MRDIRNEVHDANFTTQTDLEYYYYLISYDPTGIDDIHREPPTEQLKAIMSQIAEGS